ncbi:MAG: cysteinyl-tRNA synthetase [Satyrvirus sp.]|uniref:cysteine--tRNA ligase n=1 Tax=Satyrvirus sp. TaxID=2487771 RepID=A0A3G5AGT6_9VIRU|nr:MAG: cysteinyl-tRNA synthetase [Satyrvirus sp.]
MQTKETFLKSNVKMYVCGPTTYDHSHIGHAHTYITVDIFNRVMNSIMNLKTYLVLNITDIDDKILKKAHESGTDWKLVSNTYERSYFESMSKLNVRLPNVIIKVSDTLPQIIKYIQKIIDNGFAYVTSDGSVYFDSAAYVENGYLFSDLVDEDETVYQTELSPLIILQKKNKKDFALWKGRTKREVGFDAEFEYKGEKIVSWGRPGWHIECSSMIHETIGPDLDIHFGGIDLKFPHHYNERLQAHAFYHPKFKPNLNQTSEWSSNFYHIGHLCISGLKMSKSLKNFTTIDDCLKSVSPNELRWMFISHKWSDSMDFSDNTIKGAKFFDEKIINFFNKIVNYPFQKEFSMYTYLEFGFNNYFDEAKDKIIEELTSFKFDLAVNNLFELVNKTNSYIDSTHVNELLARKVYDWILFLVDKLGFVYQKNSDNSITDVMDVLVKTRNSLRTLAREIPKETKQIKQKLFEVLDKERNILLPAIGITLHDLKDSSSWFKNN